MPNIKEIASYMQGSVTNGWDAVLALNLKQINALFFQDYLSHGGPAEDYMHVLAMLDNGTPHSFSIIDFYLGKPDLRFQPVDPPATLEMELIKGSLITYDSQSQTIQNVQWIRPKESKLTGSLTLAKVKGEVDQVGKVVLDLGASAYTPTIGGVDPNSELNTNIGAAVKTFFRDYATTFRLGTIVPSGVSASLQPTAFQFTTQSSGQDACVLLLIQTNGQPGTVAPLATYPIPDGHTVALLIAERTIFNGVLVEAMTKNFAQFEAPTFYGQQDADGWSTVCSGGNIDCGTYGKVLPSYSNDPTPWSGDAFSLQHVKIPLGGFTLSASKSKLVGVLNCKPSQTWTRQEWDRLPPTIGCPSVNCTPFKCSAK